MQSGVAHVHKMYTKGTPTLSTKNTTIKHLKHIGKRKRPEAFTHLIKDLGNESFHIKNRREKRPEAFIHLIKDLGNESFHIKNRFFTTLKTWGISLSKVLLYIILSATVDSHYSSILMPKALLYTYLEFDASTTLLTSEAIHL